jgi:hypothetical protein
VLLDNAIAFLRNLDNELLLKSPSDNNTYIHDLPPISHVVAVPRVRQRAALTRLDTIV